MYNRLIELLGERYEIGEQIGAGGMGKVFLVRDKSRRKYYGAKVIVNKCQDFKGILGEGFAEGMILQELKHPMIPKLKEIIYEKDITIIIMEYISGITLHEYVKTHKSVSIKKVEEIGRSLLAVIIFLHSRENPIIYGDMKPLNVIIQPDGRVRLIDFGTAMLKNNQNVLSNMRTSCDGGKELDGNGTTLSLGTPGYAAPEQFIGAAKCDERTDIYSIGATLYYALTGNDLSKPPYEILPVNSQRSGIPVGLVEIINKALKKNPDERFQSAREMLKYLDSYNFGFRNRRNMDINYKEPVNIIIIHSNEDIRDMF